MYSSESEEVLSVEVGQQIVLFYQDTDLNPVEDNYITFDVDIDDNKWHRLAFSVKGDSVTLIVDCNEHYTTTLQREANSKLATDGLILIGVQLMEEASFFTVR